MNPLRHLKKPHPFIFNTFSVLIPGVVTFLIIAITAPFGFRELQLSQRLLYALLFGGIGSLTVLGSIPFLKILLPRFMDHENWTTGKEMSLILLVISILCLVNVAVIQILHLTTLSFSALVQKVVIYTVLLSILPVGIMVLAEQYSYQQKKLKQAMLLNDELQRKSISEHTTPKKSELLQLKAENNNIELQLLPDELIFLKSDGNYVEIYHRDQSGQVQVHLIRNRLKVLYKLLPNDQFFQCHKSYVVNLRQVLKVEGNARNLELLLQYSDTSIPVSRSKSMELQAILSA